MPVVTATLAYHNVIKVCNETTSTTALVARPSPDDQRLFNVEVNMEVDRQHNRVRVAEALLEASKIGDEGDLVKARARVGHQMDLMKASPSYEHSVQYYGELQRQCQQAVDGMATKQEYSARGNKFMKQSCASHFQQRSAAVSTPMGSPPSMYMNSKKAKMKKSFALFKQK